MRSAAPIAPGTWSADPTRSTVAFALTGPPPGTLRGHFEDLAAQLVVARDDEATLTWTVRTGSVVVPGRTAVQEASAQALEARRFPAMSFASSAMDVRGGFVQVDGRLTVKDTTLPVTATGTLLPGSRGEPLVLTLDTVVDRRQFGVHPAGPVTGPLAHAHETQLLVELVMRRRWVA